VADILVAISLREMKALAQMRYPLATNAFLTRSVRATNSATEGIVSISCKSIFYVLTKYHKSAMLREIVFRGKEKDHDDHVRIAPPRRSLHGTTAEGAKSAKKAFQKVVAGVE